MGSWELLRGGEVVEERKMKKPIEKLSYKVTRIGWGMGTWALNFKKGGTD